MSLSVRPSAATRRNRLSRAALPSVILAAASLIAAAAAGGQATPATQGERPFPPFRAIATWAYKYKSPAQVTRFVKQAAAAGYTHIWCFDGWAGPDGSYTNAENAGGIYVSTKDPYLAPVVMGDAGSRLVKAGHARGMKVIAFDSIFDMYGCKAKLGIDAGGETWNVGDPRVLEFYDHFTKACKAAGFDGFLFDEVGYSGTRAPALNALFSQTIAQSGFSPENIWVSMRYVISPCYDFTRWKEMGLSFSPWTIYDHNRVKNPNYPLPPELVHIKNRVVVWVYGGEGVALDVARSQFESAKAQGATGGGYWVANPDKTFTKWDWTGAYGKLLRTIFPD